MDGNKTKQKKINNLKYNTNKKIVNEKSVNHFGEKDKIIFIRVYFKTYIFFLEHVRWT